VAERTKLEPKVSNRCFGCGGANEAGMKLGFDQDNERKRISGRFRLGERYQGGGGMMHGGIIALLLDEAMGKVLRFTEERGVTAELKVEFLKPIAVTDEIDVEGWLEESKGRNRFIRGEIRDGQGTILARGLGRFVIVRQEPGKV
jgi:acyl-coenzyme A thioesterase PaaI-like protein